MNSSAGIVLSVLSIILLTLMQLLDLNLLDSGNVHISAKKLISYDGFIDYRDQWISLVRQD